MKCLLSVAMLALMTSCKPTNLKEASEARFDVEKFDLRDPRLSVEARRWLADAEDEVEIAQARVDDARSALARVRRYREDLIARLKNAWAKGGSLPEGKAALDAFNTYADRRIVLARTTLVVAEQSLALAVVRLAQARAETAVRHDLAVYDMAPIIEELERLRAEVNAALRELASQKVEVEKSADATWHTFVQFVNKGGDTNALWGIQQVR
ncbi:MAG: hypothetical protein QNJ97_13695 [Myxococcota bacterium]|nr:hypothetical protein [Myxococcota bacterium]